MSFSIPPQIDLTAYVSLAFLFGIASQFRAMDGFAFLQNVVSLFERRIGILFTIVLVTSLFSPFILNDVVVIILTPVIIRYSKQHHVDIAPLLIAEITFTNIASSLTPLGNPQNILLWTATKLTFNQFVFGTWFQLLISGIISALVLLFFRKRLVDVREYSSRIGSKIPAVYLGIVTLTVVLSSLFALPVYVSLGIAFLIGFVFTSKSLKNVLKEFDLRSLIVLSAFLATVTFASILYGSIFAQFVSPVGNGIQPYSVIFMGIMSNLISNVPATQLVLTTTSILPQVAPKIAVEAGLAGNIDPIASFANLLALLMVRRAGLSIKKTIFLQFLIGMISFLPAFL